MAKSKTLTELAAEIERQANEKRDFIAPTKALEMETTFAEAKNPEDLDADAWAKRVVTPNGVALRVGDHGTLPIRDLAHEQIGERVGVPKKYYDRMRAEAPALLATNVNHWFRNDPEKRLVRTLDGNVRAFLSDRYRPLDNFELMEAILPTLHDFGAGRDIRFESMEVTDTRLYVKIVDESIVRDFMPNAPASAHVWSNKKPVIAGLVIQNSEVGKGRLALYPSLLVKACSNQAIVWNYGMKKNHVGKTFDGFGEESAELFSDETRKADDRAFFMKVRDVLKNMLSAEVFGKILADAEEAASRAITGDPVKAIEVVAKKFSLTDGERGGVLRHLVNYGDLSQWGVSQAVTRYAQDVENYDRATDFEKLGGDIITLPASDWKVIGAAA
jgi:hypothetical protein